MQSRGLLLINIESSRDRELKRPQTITRIINTTKALSSVCIKLRFTEPLNTLNRFHSTHPLNNIRTTIIKHHENILKRYEGKINSYAIRKMSIERKKKLQNSQIIVWINYIVMVDSIYF